jgi:hypothetical protein
VIDTQPRLVYWYDLIPQAHSDFFKPMKLILFGFPDHKKPGLIPDHGRCIDVLAFAAEYDEPFPGGVAMSIQ